VSSSHYGVGQDGFSVTRPYYYIGLREIFLGQFPPYCCFRPILLVRLRGLRFLPSIFNRYHTHLGDRQDGGLGGDRSREY